MLYTVTVYRTYPFFSSMEIDWSFIMLMKWASDFWFLKYQNEVATVRRYSDRGRRQVSV